MLQPSPHPLAAISLGQIEARRASCFIPSRDPGRGEDLCSPGCGTSSWRRVFAVQQSWRTCRLEGKTTDRQQLNFTGKEGFSQVGEWGLWINKYIVFNGLDLRVVSQFARRRGSLFE